MDRANLFPEPFVTSLQGSCGKIKQRVGRNYAVIRRAMSDMLPVPGEPECPDLAFPCGGRRLCVACHDIPVYRSLALYKGMEARLKRPAYFFLTFTLARWSLTGVN